MLSKERYLYMSSFPALFAHSSFGKVSHIAEEGT